MVDREQWHCSHVSDGKLMAREARVAEAGQQTGRQAETELK